jgi:hypothetical protein
VEAIGAGDRVENRGIPAGSVTVGVTTYLRPQSLLRLEASIRRFYPALPVVVVDTGSNLSRGRNQLTRAVTTPLLLLCEDDFEFTGRTRIEPLLEVLEHDPEIEGVGGEVLEPRGRACWAHDYHRRGDEIVARPSIERPRVTRGGVYYQPCQLIFNFGLFRRRLFERVPWDEELPLNEHLDYYWRASLSGAGRMAVARGVAILHHKDRPSEAYIESRRRDFRDLANAKHRASFRTEDHYHWADEPSTAP